MNNQTIQQWLTANTEKLQAVGIDSARLDCLLLLEHELGKDRSWLLAHSSTPLTEKSMQHLQGFIARRLSHEPIAYIRGYTEFYGRQFIVSPAVLIPRPESETMLELLKKLPEPATIIDIGTGSGALAISAKLLCPASRVWALDIDADCINIAQQNAATHKAEITTHTSDLLSDMPAGTITSSTILLANLPYVPLDHPVNTAAKHEPDLALYGGTDGIDLYRTLWQQVTALSEHPMAIMCESLLSQHQAMQNLAAQYGYTCSQTDGLQQLFEPSNG